MDGITGIEDRLQDEVSDTIMKMTEAFVPVMVRMLAVRLSGSKEDLRRYSFFKGDIGFKLPVCRLESSLHISSQEAQRDLQPWSFTAVYK